MLCAAATRGALTQKAVDILMKDLAYALNQHRGKGDPEKLTGALLNALQLLPVGRLDGGRLAHVRAEQAGGLAH